MPTNPVFPGAGGASCSSLTMALLSGCLCRSEEDFRGLLNLENLRLFSYKEIRAATNNFDRRNKLGRGGFGTVYKGVWGDGTAFAAKVLCSESEQGIKEFLAEIESISEAKHAKLVRLLGCCIQRKNRILIYEYLENNSLDHALQALGSANGASLTWSTRSDICVGTAKGLSYLHEEHEPSIVHRDIKASNVLLDRDYRPKIGDFGLAKLFPCYSHQHRRGRNVAWVLYQQGSLLDMVDARMENCPEEEVLRYLRVGLACTQAAPSSRPTMGQVVALLSRPTMMRPPSFAEHRAAPDGPSAVVQTSPKARWPPPAAEPAVCSASFTYSEVAPR
ncbi:hypothetical protein C2845_PM12G21630 [Panicum miliaceum]|uniref:non-specific serine/threonine protein kinase n=1 Tax=Panicum miliaceum TaxID=4540 RepID=A0A3L6QC14_PANMI|nr:hypothetical protein C2845_PM12G21630 [Panicum miliaceum]